MLDDGESVRVVWTPWGESIPQIRTARNALLLVAASINPRSAHRIAEGKDGPCPALRASLGWFYDNLLRCGRELCLFHPDTEMTAWREHLALVSSLT